MTTVRTLNIEITFVNWMIDMLISILLTVEDIKENKNNIKGYFIDSR